MVKLEEVKGLDATCNAEVYHNIASSGAERIASKLSPCLTSNAAFTSTATCSGQSRKAASVADAELDAPFRKYGSSRILWRIRMRLASEPACSKEPEFSLPARRGRFKVSIKTTELEELEAECERFRLRSVVSHCSGDALTCAMSSELAWLDEPVLAYE